jgi:hypothetical protein
MNDLNRAVDTIDIAINITQDHPNQASILSNLGNLLGRRFERTGSIDDINRAIDITDMAINTSPQDYPNRDFMLNNLGILLSMQFKQTKSMNDLNRAINSCVTNNVSCYSN